MEIEKKIPIHIGFFGHIDSGKTKIAEVLSEIISTAGIDAHPQSKERGITIDLGFTSFILERFLITLVDAPGHADLIKISASSVEIIDCALIVIDINKGPQVQTGEHLIMIESLNIDKIIVILNKIDLFSGIIEEEIKKTRDFFNSTCNILHSPFFYLFCITIGPTPWILSFSPGEFCILVSVLAPLRQEMPGSTGTI